MRYTVTVSFDVDADDDNQAASAGLGLATFLPYSIDRRVSVRPGSVVDASPVVEMSVECLGASSAEN